MKTNWTGLQRERAVFLSWYGGLIPSALRAFVFVAGVGAVFILLLGLILKVSPTLTGFSLIIISPWLAALSFHWYVTYLREHPEYLVSSNSRNSNPLNSCDYPAVRSLLILRRRKSWRPYFDQLFGAPAVKNLMYRLGLTEDVLQNIFSSQQPSADEAEQILAKARSLSSGDQMIDSFQLLLVMSEYPAMKSYLSTQKVSADLFRELADFYRNQSKLLVARHFWLDNTPDRSGGFAKDWSVGYTNLLDQYTEELKPSLNKRARYFPFYGREELQHRVITELNKATGRNILLVGEPGIGKTELFYAIASKILNNQTKSDLDGKQVRILNLQSIMAATSKQEQLAPFFQALFGDLVHAGNVVLFVPDIDLLFDSSDEAGTINATHLFSDYLNDQRINLVGTITQERYISLIKSEPLLSEHFSSIEVEPPEGESLLKILLVNLPPSENKYKVFFPVQSLESVIDLSSRYIRDKASPEREIALIEEIAADCHGRGVSFVSPDEVAKVVERKAKVPIRVDEQEQNTLLNLEQELHKRVIGQERAVKLVSDSLLRARAGLSKGVKPIGSFLFLGPTGVGKTETAKALADIYFGSPDKLVRLDMTEFAGTNGLEKLLGTDAVKLPGSLTTQIQQNPSSVLLFDEIEKAHDSVRNVLLQLLDEGKLTTNFGKVLDFTNTIVIATSNAGSDFIKQQVEAGNTTFEKQLIDNLIASRIYLPEFLNRFDGVVVYLPLSLTEIKQVVSLQLEMLKNTVKTQRGVELIIAESVVSELARRGYDPVFGARALQRVIKNDLETVIARELIAQQVSPGSKLTINSI